MSRFEGFRSNYQGTAIPDVFFTQLMPQIKDAAELRIVLHMFWAVKQKKRSPRFVTFRELLGDKMLAPSLGENLAERVEVLERGLRGAVEKGVLITAEVEAKGFKNRLYLVNTEVDRRALGRIERREMDIGGIPLSLSIPEEEPAINIYAIYQNNIGSLNPLIADDLKRAETTYPEGWIADAIHEAVRQGVRRWSYIEKILKSWKEEGRTVGEIERHTRSRDDTAKYFKGRYGHLVKRRLD